MDTKITPKKRILSVILTVIMMFSTVPMSTLAADNGAAEVTTDSSTVIFNVYDDAVAYANKNGGTLKLLADITSPQYETINEMPFITGNVTLDLNGKSIDFVDVGSVSYDEENDETTKVDPGTLTVIGDGSVGVLTVNYGTLTLKEGNIEELTANGFAATVNIIGGTVERLVLSALGDERIFADVSGGSVQALDLSGAIATFNGGNHGSKTGHWGINSGTLNITDGSFSTVKFLITGGNISLTGGEFEYISTEPQAASSEYKKPTLGSLLGDNCAFYGTDGSIVNADVLTLENVKIVADHEHTYKNGKCTTCGAMCNHKGKVNYGDGVCDACDTQLEAEVEYENGTATYFTSFQSAIDSIPHGMKQAVTVYLLKDFYTIDDDLYLGNANIIKLNLNAKVLSGKGKIIVKYGSSLIIMGGTSGDIDYDLTIEAAGGDVTFEEDCDDIGNISVTSADSNVSIKSGNAEKLSIDFTDTESLKNIKLLGGNFKMISFPNAGNSDKVVITDILESGYAFKDNKGILAKDSSKLVSYELTVSAKTYFAELEVVKCSHSAINEVKGYCNYCGKPYEAKVTDENGNKKYIDKITDSDLYYAKNCTVTLLRDVDRCNVVFGLTFDLNGHHLKTLELNFDDETVTIKGSGTISRLYLGRKTNLIGSPALVIDEASGKTIHVDYCVVRDNIKFKLNSGSFRRIQRKDDLTINDLLADGYAFFDKNSGKPIYLGNETDVTGSYYIAKHDHAFTVNADGRNECECGLICDHTDIGENGKCENCKTQIYSATLTKADGTTVNYDTFAESWTAAIENIDSTLKLLCNVTLNNAENGIVAQSGKFTFDLNGFEIIGGIRSQLLTVSGMANITIKNGKLTNALDNANIGPTDASALKVDGGDVTFDNVEATGGRGEDWLRSYAVCVYDGSFTVLSGIFNGAIAAFPETKNEHPSLKITTATLNDGIEYANMYEDACYYDYAGLKASFADGSILLDGNGKYIDITDEKYWWSEDSLSMAGFSCSYKCIVKPHTHTYANGVCSECDYVCPHDSDNECEASYFKKAICSVCHSEYGNYAKDTTLPTGEIIIKERTWWQSLLNTISFGLFFNEEVTVQITANDDSYTHLGYDETKHAVKIEYFISDRILSEKAVTASSDFKDYTAPINLSTEQQFVVYVRLTDHAGNVAYAGSDGFEIDKTAPVIEDMTNGGRYIFCGEKTITVTEKNVDKVILDDKDISLDENGKYALYADSKEHKIFVSDKAGNETTVYVTLYPSHDFDLETEICRQCGKSAVAKVDKGEISDRFVSGDELFKALSDEKYSGAIVTFLTDVTIDDYAHLKYDLTIDLNGKKLKTDNNVGITIDSGATTIISSNGEGSSLAAIALNGTDASLTMGKGIGDVKAVIASTGKLTINSGRYGMLISMYDTVSEAERINLCGGWFNYIRLKSAFCSQILGNGYRFSGISYSDAQKTTLSNASVVLCDHANVGSDNICTDCNTELFLSVKTNETTKLFATFESAIRYAEQNSGCTVTLLQDLLLDKKTVGSMVNMTDYIELNSGTYTLDLGGKTLTIGDWSNGFNALTVYDGCNLTVTDTLGGGKVKSYGAALEVRGGGRLTINDGDYSGLSKVLATGSDSLTIKGGKFKQVCSKEGSDSVSPLNYLADGCAFMLNSGEYANESNVNSEYISGQGRTYWIENVTVVPAPVIIPTIGQPNDTTFYLTSPNGMKYVGIAASYVGEDTEEMVTITLEKTDGTLIETGKHGAVDTISTNFDLTSFTAENSGEYRIKVEFNGYVLYSRTFTVTVAVCDHPDYAEDTHKCSKCFGNLAAVIINGDKTTGYMTFADALTAAQTNENKGCVLKSFANVNGNAVVKSGKFTLDAANTVINGKLNVAKGVDLTVSGGVITGNVICAKGGKLTAVKSATFTGSINCVGEGSFSNCQLAGTVAGKGGLKLHSCEITGSLSISGNATADECIISGAVTVNNGGKLKSTGDTYRNTVNAKSGGTLEIVSGILDGKVTVESGSTFIVSNGTYADVTVEKDVNFTLSSGKFGEITIIGKRLIDYLANGMALEDMGTNDVIDGRVSIASNVRVVSHTHSCIWKTATHEKLCGCGYVESTDTEAPIISGVENGKTYYGGVEFSVKDDNDFTVTVDGNPVRLTLGSYIIEPDNEQHTISATDVAGNTSSVTVYVYKLYKITLSHGAGYVLRGAPVAGYGTDYNFTLEIAEGYSKTDNFMVDVNGMPMRSDSGNYTVSTVTSDIFVTVFGIADITPPEAEISIGTNKFNSFMNAVTFGLFFKKTKTVTVTARDNGSGLKKVEYLLSETAFENKDSVSGDWTELALTNGTATFDIEPNKKAYVYVRVMDESGNIRIINSDGVVVYTDSESITEAINFTMLDKNDVSFDVRLNGNTVKALYNGDVAIESGSYDVTDGKITLKNSYLKTLSAGEYTIRVSYNPMGEEYETGDEPTMTSVKLTVEKAEAQIGFFPNNFKKDYDGQPIKTPGFTTNSKGNVTVEYKPSGADDSSYSTAAPKTAGKYVIRISVAETDTHKSAAIEHDYEILKKSVTIVGTAVEQSKIYDGTTSAKITNVGTVSDNYDGDNLIILKGKATYDDKNVGADKNVSFTDFALSGSAADNYILTKQPESVAANITAREVTVNGTTVEPSKVYDGTTSAKITNLGSLSENFDKDDLSIECGSANYDDKNVGTAKRITFSGFRLIGAAASNYILVSQPNSVSADITPKKITISGVTVEQSKIYDGTTSAKITNVGTVSDNYDGDNLIIVKGKATYDDKKVGTDKNVSFTDFALSGSAADNYILTKQPESVAANITAKEIKIIDVSVEASKIYDGNIDAKITSSGSLDGMVDGDNVNIVTGKAAYEDKNVGADKTVSFYDFAISGDDFVNYELSAQPESTTAAITPKELTIDNIKVKDKQYDGKNTAELDGTPKLVGVVDGDMIELINGTPTFDSVTIGNNISISFTEFALSGDSVTVGNYILKQPSDITANIVEFVADGSEYSVNSNDWINTDFIITAKDGYKLSLTDSANGEWTDSLSKSDETANGTLVFYVKNSTTGVISTAVTENYKIDKTLPTGEVKLNERTAFQTFLNKITFGLFYNNAVNVKLTATDELSGIKSVMYYKSDKLLTDDEVFSITDWTDNSDFDIEANDMDKFIIYVKIEDNAGNVEYIGSDGAIFDTSAPKIEGVEDGKTYYVSKNVTVSDTNLESVTLNGNAADSELVLKGNVNATYVIHAVDKAGNVTEYTINMLPISSITDSISAITVDNVKSSDSETVDSVKAQLESVDMIGANETEENELKAAVDKCNELENRISETSDEIVRLGEQAGTYDINTVTSDDKADIEKLIGDIDALLGGDNLTDAERDELEALKDAAAALLDQIANAASAANDPKITNVDGITKDNVKSDDKDALEKAKDALEKALRDFDDNYTDEERNELQNRLDVVNSALDAIKNAENKADENDNHSGSGDDNADENSPQTGNTDCLGLWISLLFISGGAMFGVKTAGKKKKQSME